MARTNMNVNVTSRQQQVSKILRSQLISGMESQAKYCSDVERLYDTVEYRIVTSRAFQNGCITAWTSKDFGFTFEYSRKKYVRVSYMNSDGMISAIFSEQQWICMTTFLQNKLDGIIAGRAEAIEEAERKAEERELQRRIDAAVEKALRERDESKYDFKAVNNEMAKVQK